MMKISHIRTSLILLILIHLIACRQETYFNITTQTKPDEGGYVEMTPSSSPVFEGTSVTFKAVPRSEYIFTGWGGSLSGTENPKTVTVTAAMDVLAKFELKTYSLSVSVEGEGTVNERVVTTKTDYGSGTEVELMATPFTGWSFDHWEGDLAGANNPARIAISGAKSIKAIFIKKSMPITSRLWDLV